MRERLRARPVAVGVGLVTALALVARLVGLGGRTMHFDEARVAFRILEYGRSGVWAYDSIVHGPFLFHVNAVLFEVLGRTDTVARLPVALVGGLLPATAWLFRERLTGTETVAVAGFLAANPVLLYYSRFMRNDVLVAAFALAAFGFGVRLLDTGRPRHLYAAGLTLALAATTKENALIYVGMWVGAVGLVLDRELLLARTTADGARGPLRRLGARVRDGLAGWGGHLLGALLVGLVVLVAFYAPRPDLGRALGTPGRLPAVFEAATLGSWREFAGTWAGNMQDHAYLPYLLDYVRTLGRGGLAVTVLGGVGLVANRYADRTHRPLVAVCGFWAAASLLVYPLATDIQAAWTTVHTVVPAAVPAAVAVGLLADRGRAALAADDAVATGLVAVVALGVVAQVVVAAGGLVYANPTGDTPMVQFGQPADDLDPALETVETVADRTEGTDVLFLGLKFNNDPGSLQFDRLPWPWYLAAMDATVDGARTVEPLRDGTTPPVVVVAADAPYITGVTESDATAYLEGYTRIGAYAIVQDVPGSVVYTVVYVRTSVLPAGAG